MVLGVWCLPIGLWRLVLGVWLLVFGAWCMVLGSWFLVLGARCLVLGAWCLVFGACLMMQTRTGAQVVSVLWKMRRCQVLKFGSQSDHLCSSNCNKGRLAALLAFWNPKLVLTLQLSSCHASPSSLAVLRPCFFASSPRSFAASLILCFLASFVLVRSFFLCSWLRLVLGAWCLVLGVWRLVLGVWRLVFRYWCVVIGAW